MLKKSTTIITLLLTLLLFSISGFAIAEFSATSKTITNNIYTDQEAEFDFTITNNADTDESYIFTTDDTLWSLQSAQTTLLTTGIDVQAKSSKTFTVFFKPSKNIFTGKFPIALDFISKTDPENRKSVAINIFVIPKPNEELKSDIALTLYIPEKVDPRETLIVVAELTNKNMKKYDSLIIEAKGLLINEEFTTNLDGIEQKTIEFNVTFNPYEKPQKDNLVVSVSEKKSNSKKEIIAFDQEEIEIISYSPPLIVRTYENKSFLKTVNTLTLTNEGNVNKVQEVSYNTNTFQRFFTFFEKEIDAKYSEGKFKIIQEVEPQEHKELKITTNYRSLLYTALLTLLAALIYFYTRSPIILTKKGKVTKRKENGITQVKVQLGISNRSNKQVHNVQIFEKISNMAEYAQVESLGTIQPNKVMQRESGTLLEFDIPKLESKEERIITYTINSKLPVLGLMKLVPARAKFKRRGSFRKVKSNVFEIEA